MSDVAIDLQQHRIGGFLGAIGELQTVSWPKTVIAAHMLDAACRVFLEGGHGSVVINLAGVAEELFEAELKRVGRDGDRFVSELALKVLGPSPTSQDRTQLWNFVREPRNSIKHWNRHWIDAESCVSTDSSSVLYSLVAAIYSQLQVEQPLSESTLVVAQSLNNYQQSACDVAD